MYLFKKKPLLIIGLLLTLTACGEGNNDSTETSSTAIGVFLDSPVSNIGYRTETKTGFTNSKGEFEFIPGETVTFFIGDLQFPSVSAASVVTPLDIAGTNDFSNTSIINMARLLQSLDTDGDPSNGIVIGQQAHSAAINFNIDFSSNNFDTDVQLLVADSGSSQSSLVSESAALLHLSSNVQCAETLDNYLTGKRINIGLGSVTFNYDGSFIDTIVENGITYTDQGTYSISGLKVNMVFEGGDNNRSEFIFNNKAPKAGDKFHAILYFLRDHDNDISTPEIEMVDGDNSNAPVSSIVSSGRLCF